MSLISDKKSIFTEIGAFNSITSSVELPNSTSSISSLNNSEDIGAFLLDILVTLVGSEVLKKVTGELLGDFIEETKPVLLGELSKQLIDFNSTSVIPSSFATNGYTVPAKDIDVYGKLKSDPASNIGSQIYSENANTDTFDRKAYLAITTPNTEVIFNNISILYNDANDTFTFKPLNSNDNIAEFIGDFTSGMNLFDRKTFLTEVLNIIFGTKSAAQNKSVMQILEENKINKVLQNFIDSEEDLAISDDELTELEDDARQAAQGFREICIGCCTILRGSMSVEEMTDLNDRFRNAATPDEAGNILSDGVINSFSGGEDPDTAEENERTIKDGIIKRIINAIIRILSAAITTTPEARFIIITAKAFKNNNVIDASNPSEDLINFKLLIKCLIKKVKELIFEFLFNLVKEELVKLIIPISKRILREKINQYIGVLRSLIGFG